MTPSRLAALLLLLGIAMPIRADEKPRVVELFEDEAEATVSQLINEGGEGGAAVRDDTERYSGGCSIRVTPLQRYTSQLKGWSFPVVEKPGPGQYRYIRFAWKKSGGAGIMLQLCAVNQPSGWEHRYVAGQQSVPWAALNIAPKAPDKWEVVTRDLFKDFGTFTLTGIAFTPMDGTAGYYDHIYLGRSAEDLDSVTNAVLATKPVKAPATAEREKLWNDLGSSDAFVVAPARRLFAAGGKETVTFLSERLKKEEPADGDKKVMKLIAELDDEEFEVRQRASAELAKLGEKAERLLKKALAETKSAEVKRRIEMLLADRTDDGLAEDQVRYLHVLRALEQIGTDEARALVQTLPKEKLAPAVRAEVKIALDRWKTRKEKPRE